MSWPVVLSRIARKPLYFTARVENIFQGTESSVLVHPGGRSFSASAISKLTPVWAQLWLNPVWFITKQGWSCPVWPLKYQHRGNIYSDSLWRQGNKSELRQSWGSAETTKNFLSGLTWEPLQTEKHKCNQCFVAVIVYVGIGECVNPWCNGIKYLYKT